MGTLTVAGASAGLASGQKVIGPVTITGNNTIGEILDATLASGDNTFAVPTGTTAVAVFLGLAPSATVKIRTNLNPTDSGWELAPYASNGWFASNLPAGTTSIILNASAAVSGVELSFI